MLVWYVPTGFTASLLLPLSFADNGILVFGTSIPIEADPRLTN